MGNQRLAVVTGANRGIGFAVARGLAQRGYTTLLGARVCGGTYIHEYRSGKQERSWSKKPRHLLRDRDAVYGRDFTQSARRVGIDTIATPVRSPRANAIVERGIGTLRRECLDHVIVLDEQHLRSVLAEFVRYYNHERPHRTLGLQTPEPRPRPAAGAGPVHSRPVLNGLHHVYERAA